MELGGAPRPPVRGKLHTVGITFLWNDQGWGGQKGMLSVVRDGGEAPDDYAPWSPDVMCGKEPAPHVETSDYGVPSSRRRRLRDLVSGGWWRRTRAHHTQNRGISPQIPVG